jgi:hypothetical protein
LSNIVLQLVHRGFKQGQPLLCPTTTHKQTPIVLGPGQTTTRKQKIGKGVNMKRNVVLAFAAQNHRRQSMMILRRAVPLLVPRRRFVQVTHAVTGETVCRVYFHRSGGHLRGRDVHNAANAKVDSDMETRLWNDAERTLRGVPATAPGWRRGRLTAPSKSGTLKRAPAFER